MRNMSFALTTDQVRHRQKTVTRRLGWRFLTGGELVQPVVKVRGFRKGERLQTIGGPIKVHARFELLRRMLDDEAYGREECIREGFPEMTPAAFVAMFCATHPCTPDDEVTRIEFEYLGANQIVTDRHQP